MKFTITNNMIKEENRELYFKEFLNKYPKAEVYF